MGFSSFDDFMNPVFFIGVGVGALLVSCLYIFVRLVILIVSRILKARRQSTQYQPISKRQAGTETELQPMGGNVYVIDDEEAQTLPLQAPSSKPTHLKLDESPTIDPDEFQQEWSSNVQRGLIEMRLSPGSDVEKLLTANNICCMASGAVGNQVKYYFFAQKESVYFMIEVIISLTSYDLVAKIRCSDDEMGQLFTEHLESVLNQVAEK